jgi:aspartate racemase
VLDETLRLVTPGSAGELHLGGLGLARGYLNRPELTKEKFVPHPHSCEPGARLYKTGDLVRSLPDGTLEYLGRLDHQVKIRGYRIELGEIEAELARYPGVHQTLVVAREEESGDKRLVAYIAADPVARPSFDAVRGYLRNKLPAYMVPSAFVLLDAFPLTPNGKVDRRSLPAPSRERSQALKELLGPRNDLEAQLVKMWEQLLEIQPIGIRDNFFELGGDSLLAARLLAHIHELFGRELPVSTLIQEATVEYLARLITTPADELAWPCLVAVQPRGSKRPLFLVHALGGEILMYTPLAHQLNADQPVYAFRAQGRDGGGQPCDCLEEMAAKYVDEMLEAQPQGPFLLGGYSFGGIVAFEMAQQLHKRGHKVALLLLIDMELPHMYRRYLNSPKWLFNFACNVPRWLLHTSHPCTVKERYVSIRKRLSIVRMAVEGLLRFSYEDPGPLGVVSVGDMLHVPKRYRNVLNANYKAIMSYVPQPYAGQVTLIRARTQPLICSLKRDMGWGQLAASGVEVLDVPGYHDSMFKEPVVRILGTQVRRCLAKAAGNL